MGTFPPVNTSIGQLPRADIPPVKSLFTIVYVDNNNEIFIFGFDVIKRSGLPDI